MSSSIMYRHIDSIDVISRYYMSIAQIMEAYRDISVMIEQYGYGYYTEEETEQASVSIIGLYHHIEDIYHQIYHIMEEVETTPSLQYMLLDGSRSNRIIRYRRRIEEIIESLRCSIEGYHTTIDHIFIRTLGGTILHTYEELTLLMRIIHSEGILIP